MRPEDDSVLPVVSAAELDEPDPDNRWLISNLWARAGVGIIGGAPKCLLCRARHKRHHPASRIMPRESCRGMRRRRFLLADAA